jgi:hypothetical protein
MKGRDIIAFLSTGPKYLGHFLRVKNSFYRFPIFVPIATTFSYGKAGISVMDIDITNNISQN